VWEIIEMAVSAFIKPASSISEFSIGIYCFSIYFTQKRLDILTNRIKEELGFEPEYDVTEGMRAYIAWIKDR
jgi:nucleoside-diphosphate-sugar epimerase